MKCFDFFNWLQGVLHAERLSNEEDSQSDKEKLSAADLQFLRSGFTFKDKHSMPTENGSPRDNSEKFDESWPITERPSSLRFVQFMG